MQFDNWPRTANGVLLHDHTSAPPDESAFTTHACGSK
jgi:hypothetical protein